MALNRIENIIQLLKTKGVSFDKGLSQDEFVVLKDKFDIIFPPDLRLLLATALPTSERFPNWRKLFDDSDDYLKESIMHPEEGILFDIENDEFWYAPWGEKPKELTEALLLAKEKLKNVPKIVRVYSHRYIPLEPLEEGNPIFSISQTDIIYYGENLENYFQNEFNRIPGSRLQINHNLIKKIPFWSDLTS